MTDTKQLIEAQFNRLPAELQQALNAVPWKSLVNEISILKTLSIEQVETIERETLFILYGFENPAGYIANLMREAGVGEEVATTIAQEVDEKILKPIAEKIEGGKKQTPTDIFPKESKEDAMKRLLEKREQTGQKAAAPTQEPQSPGREIEAAPEIHPMVEKNEVAHDVPQINRVAQPEPPKPAESTPTTTPPPQPTQEKPIQTPEPTLQNSEPIKPVGEKPTATPSIQDYPKGQDPYREPLE